MKNEVAVFTTTDLQAAGINSQLTANDLIEVVAHDIYDKYISSINDVIDAGEKLHEGYYKLLDSEISKMKKSLSKYLKSDNKIDTVDEDDLNYQKGISASFGRITGDNYWPSLDLYKVSMSEKDKGTTVDNRAKSLNVPSFKQTTAKVKLTITTGVKSYDEELKIGNISGIIETTYNKTFTQNVSIPISRFKAFAEKVKEYNNQVSDLLKFLPKNGVLSVDRFTKDARVKMNKKMLSAQSPDFRKKISELFNIKL